MKECIFCEIIGKAERIFLSNTKAIAVYDKYPISPGHALIIPRRHIPDFFSLDDDEVKALYSLINEVRAKIDLEYKPDGYNIGINNGRAAGQTIEHLHIHLIPRYKGDVEMPAGGVRHILLNNAKFYKEIVGGKI